MKQVINKNMFGKRLMELRNKHNHTQGDMKKKTGISQKSISKAENGHFVFRPLTLNKIYKSYNIDASYFFHKEEKPETTSRKSNVSAMEVMDKLKDLIEFRIKKHVTDTQYEKLRDALLNEI